MKPFAGPAFALCTIVFAAQCTATVHGQSQSAQARSCAQAETTFPRPAFDVGSVRQSPPADSYTVSGDDPTHASLVRLTNYILPNLLSTAYGVDWFQIEGLPPWTWRSMFNIQAKSDPAVDEQLAKMSDADARCTKQLMFQSLLNDRFRLRTHWGTKQGTTYRLEVAKSGSKLKPAGSIPISAEEKRGFGDSMIPPLYQRGDGRLGYEFIAHGASIAQLADTLQSQMGTRVVDSTHLSGRYDFTLRYKGSTETDDEPKNDPAAWPPLITALPDQLGLKLAPTKGEIKTLVIDHVELPSPN